MENNFYPDSELKTWNGWDCAQRDRNIARLIRERGLHLHDFVFFHEWGDSDLATGSWGMIVEIVDEENFKVYWWDNSYEYSNCSDFPDDDNVDERHYSVLIPFDIGKDYVW